MKIPGMAVADEELSMSVPTGDEADAPSVIPVDAPAEAIQVAGPISALKGLLKGGAKAAKGVAKEVPPAAAASAAPPPMAPKPPKSVPEIKQGVMDRTAPSMDEARAQGVAAELTSPQPAAEPGRTAWRNFRSDKLDTTDNIKALIDDIAESSGGFVEQRRGVVSQAQTAQEAKTVSIEDLLGTKPGTAFSAKQLHGGTQVMLELARRLEKAAPLITSGAATAEDLLAYRHMAGQLAAVQEVLQGGVAEAGRALNILKSVRAAGGQIRSQQIAEALGTMGGDEVTKKIAQTIMDAKGDPAKIAKVAKQAEKITSMDVFNEVYINGLLSGPTTHIVNAIGNSLSQLMQIPERAVAGVISKVSPGQGGVALDESAYLAQGMIASWRDAFSAFGKVAMTGNPTDPIAKIENQGRKAFTSQTFGLSPDSVAGKAVDLFGEYYVRIPGRVMMATDELFKTVAYRGEIEAQAARQAAQEGLSGQARTDRIAELVQNPTEDVHKAGEKASRYLTFQDTLSGDNWVQVVGQAGQKLSGLPLGKLVLPFVRTPTNIAQYTLERTPFAPTLKTWRDDVAAGGARRDLALARFGLGSSAAAVVASYAASGRITGNGPDNPAQRAQLMATGWRPYSVLIGDQYVSYNRLDPIGAMIGAAADASDVLRYAQEDEATIGAVTAAVGLGFANAMTNKTYLAGLGGVIDGLRQADNGRLNAAQTGVAKMGASLTPAWLNFIRNNADDLKRAPPTGDLLSQTVAMMRNRTPGLSGELPPDVDIMGEHIVAESAPLNPIKSSTLKNDPVLEAMFRHEVSVEKPSSAVSVGLKNSIGAKTIGVAVDLNVVDPTGWLLHDYRQAVGRNAKREMDKVVNSKAWTDTTVNGAGEKVFTLTKEEAQKEVSRVWLDAKHDALNELIDAHPEIEQAAEAAMDKPGTNRMRSLPWEPAR